MLDWWRLGVKEELYCVVIAVLFDDIDCSLAFELEDIWPFYHISATSSTAIVNLKPGIFLMITLRGSHRIPSDISEASNTSAAKKRHLAW